MENIKADLEVTLHDKSAEDDGNEPFQVYAIISAEHKAKKRWSYNTDHFGLLLSTPN